MLIYATYFDHISRGGYNPWLCIRNWKNCDKGVVFVGPGQLDKVAMLPVDAIEIPIGINKPSDIPAAQNYCVDWCYNELGADWLLYTQGDIVLRPSGDEFVGECASAGRVGTIPSMAVSLYSKMWIHTAVVSLSNRDGPVLYDPRGDGQNCGMLGGTGPLVEDGRYTWDVGYLGLPQYYAKMVNHAYIWGGDEKVEWVGLYGRDRDAAVVEAYKKIQAVKHHPLEWIDVEEYGEMLDMLGLWDDYGYCKRVVEL